MYKFTLRFSMLSIFLTLFVVTMVTVITITSLRFFQSMQTISRQQMSQVTALVNKELSTVVNPAESSSKLSIKMIENNIIDIKTPDELITYTMRLLASIPNAAMVYWGDEKGNFVISRLEDDGTLSSEIINRNLTPATSTYIYRDKNSKIIKTTTSENVIYDPRKRPWYLAAKDVQKTTWSNAYVFFSGNNKVLGITSASPVYDDKRELIGVFGIDMRLDSISKFLSKQKIGKTGVAFIVDKEGFLIAHPNLIQFQQEQEKAKITPIEKLNIPWQTEAFHKLHSHEESFIRYAWNGEIYLASFQLIPNFKEQEWYISVVIPENDFVGELKESNKMNIIIAMIILILGSILITAFSKTVSKSLKKLVVETHKIKNFNLTEGETINSHIKEISQLYSGIVSMRKGLKAFKKYVPADLVRLLISKGESARLGGTKKEITILFTDIRDFTGISETTTPEKLMQHLCDYFDQLSQIIKNNQGTIDKYIGDSVMAFWGSPTADKYHALHACRTAYEIIKALNDLNKTWEHDKKPIMPTRIGIHSGEAIIGNLGSSSRLNYTAIGDTVNAGSRLESINTVYGTQIITSQATKDIVDDDFIFRPLDCIAVKGKREGFTIYELLELKTPAKIEELKTFCEESELAFKAYENRKWEVAIQHYKKVLEIKPNDSVANLFIKRCDVLMKEPPPSDWDGVWRFEHK